MPLSGCHLLGGMGKSPTTTVFSPTGALGPCRPKDTHTSPSSLQRERRQIPLHEPTQLEPGGQCSGPGVPDGVGSSYSLSQNYQTNDQQAAPLKVGTGKTEGKGKEEGQEG